MATNWTVPEFSPQEINQAGRMLVDIADIDYDDYEWALRVINNHRSSHSYPLNTFTVTLRNYARSVDTNSLVAQRIKRLTSIHLKLLRFQTMRLVQMQDLGGCRAVVGNINDVRKLKTRYDASGIKHERLAVDDYITSPQASGYRGIHLIYRYNSDKTREYNGLKLEVQLRSRFQHAWATAVETVGTFVRQALKSSMGEADWLRFFQLMGTAVAMRERSAPVPATPTNSADLIAELRHYANALNVAHRLRAFNAALRTLQDDQASSKGQQFFLLELDPAANQLLISGFKKSEIANASEQYLEAEKRVKENAGRDAVLVSVDTMASLQRAYPNYFADTRVFLMLMNQTLSNVRSRIVE
jgi:ppGpp synthetase/RelA/SpoT-type nucleotidyltranferase